MELKLFLETTSKPHILLTLSLCSVPIRQIKHPLLCTTMALLGCCSFSIPKYQETMALETSVKQNHGLEKKRSGVEFLKL
jgi:hypothetical protein